MGWSYSGNPNGSALDAVRFWIQDTNTNKQLVQDEEIEYVLTQEMNVYMAASKICRSLVVRAGGAQSKKISDFAITYNLHTYAELAASLEARGMNYQMPYLGSASKSQKLTLEQSSDFVQPAFSKGLDENTASPDPDFDNALNQR